MTQISVTLQYTNISRKCNKHNIKCSVITLYIRNCSAYCDICEKNPTNATEKHAADVSIIGVKLRFGQLLGSITPRPQKKTRHLLGMSSTGRMNQTGQKQYPLCCNICTKGYSKPTSYYCCGKSNLLIETIGFDKTHAPLD